MAKAAVPKRQAYPASVIAVGTVLYSVLAWTDDKGKTSTEYQEWVVRSIKARRGSKSRMGHAMFASGDTRQFVNLTQKIPDLTWVRRQGKAGWATSIPGDCTKQLPTGDDLPEGIYTTQRAALVFAIREHQRMHARFGQWMAEAVGDEREEWRAELITHEAEMRALATRFTKQFGKRPSPPA